jgi:hypothetical protein
MSHWRKVCRGQVCGGVCLIEDDVSLSPLGDDGSRSLSADEGVTPPDDIEMSPDIDDGPTGQEAP